MTMLFSSGFIGQARADGDRPPTTFASNAIFAGVQLAAMPSEVLISTARVNLAIPKWQEFAYQYLQKQHYYYVEKPGTTQKPWSRHFGTVTMEEYMLFQKTRTTKRVQCYLKVKYWISEYSPDVVRVNTTAPAGCPWVARAAWKIPEPDPVYPPGTNGVWV